MLKIRVRMGETFDEDTNKFIFDEFELRMEHSLASLSKWEAKFEKVFLNTKEMTSEETIYYIQECMTLSDDIPDGVFSKFSKENFEAVREYINSKQSATWFNEQKQLPRGPRTNQSISAAVIAGWMVALNIPYEMRYVHLNELFNTIRVVNDQTKPKKKMSRQDAARQQTALNNRRRAEMGTAG